MAEVSESTRVSKWESLKSAARKLIYRRQRGGMPLTDVITSESQPPAGSEYLNLINSLPTTVEADETGYAVRNELTTLYQDLLKVAKQDSTGGSVELLHRADRPTIARLANQVMLDYHGDRPYAMKKENQDRDPKLFRGVQAKQLAVDIQKLPI